MKVFLSCSLDRGRLIAEALRSWLPDVIQRVEPWVVTSEDMIPGTRWSSELARQLNETKFGVLCVARESVRSPGLLFEAGALAKTVENTFVCPVLLDVSARELGPPLDQFDAVTATSDGLLKLVKSINRALPPDEVLSDDRVRRVFDRFWPDLEAMLQAIPKAPSWAGVPVVGSESIGWLEVFRNRPEALERFSVHLQEEMAKPDSSKPFVYFTGTSLRGFLVTTGKAFDGKRVIRELAGSACDLRVMMVHPSVADLRASQERRIPGAIANEVKADAHELLGLGLREKHIRYYRGAPTVFGIATSEMMLLNPYPAEDESHRCFSMIVRKTEDTQDIYHQYFGVHFDYPWQNAVALDSNDIQTATLVNSRSPALDDLSAQFDGLLVRMQTPRARKGMAAAFNASPTRLGRAAVKAAAKRR